MNRGRLGFNISILEALRLVGGVYMRFSEEANIQLNTARPDYVMLC